MKATHLTLILAAMALTFSACRKDEEENNDDTTTPPTEATTSVAIHNMDRWGGDAFALNTDYAWGSGNIRFSEIRFYLSDFHLHGDADDEHAIFMNQAILIEAGNSQMQTVGSIGFTHVHMADLLLGLNYDTNHEQNPAEADPPLNDATMHWGWNPDQGYKFVKVEGEQDVDGDGTFAPFSIHCATDDLKRELTWMVEADAVDDAIEMHVMIDYQAMFDGIDFGNLSGTHGNSALTNQVADQLADAISLN